MGWRHLDDVLGDGVVTVGFFSAPNAMPGSHTTFGWRCATVRRIHGEIRGSTSTSV